MVNNPKLIVADEPTGNLDPETSENIMAILQEINRSGSTVVVCTHDSNLVDRMKKRVIEIDAGLIARDEKDSKYAQDKKPEEKEFAGYGIENPGFAFGDDPNFKEDGEYSDNYDDENYETPTPSEFFFGETPPEVAAAEAEAKAKAAEAALVAEEAAKAVAEAAEQAALETVEETAEATSDDIEEAEEAEEDVTHENYSAQTEEKIEEEESAVPTETEAQEETTDDTDEATDETKDAADSAVEEAEDESSEEDEAPAKDPADFVFNDDDKKTEEKKEEPKAEEEEDKGDDWIEEVSLNDIDLDIQEDDD
jgi:ABC-type multidrug transport system ATPase subunit